MTLRRSPHLRRGEIGPRFGSTVVGSMASLGSLMLLALLLMLLMSCSPEAHKEKPHVDEDARQALTSRETTSAPKRAASVLEGQAKARPGSHARWDYVALGNSLAAGVGARRGYVDHYAEYLRGDTEARLRVINLGRRRQTSWQLL